MKELLSHLKFEVLFYLLVRQQKPTESERRGVHTWRYWNWMIQEKCQYFLKVLLWLKCCYFKSLINKLTKRRLQLNPTRCCKTRTCDKGYFYYCYDRAMDTQVCCHHSQALIRLLLEKMKRFKKGTLHIWREVPFTRLKETGRGKRKQRTQTRMTQHFNRTGINVPLPHFKRHRAVGQM